jgi:hypothetical protein
MKKHQTFGPEQNYCPSGLTPAKKGRIWYLRSSERGQALADRLALADRIDMALAEVATKLLERDPGHSR